ncbi:MAG: hypothetical protein ACLS4Z_06550 [Christensenellaceae bacterium]
MLTIAVRPGRRGDCGKEHLCGRRLGVCLPAVLYLGALSSAYAYIVQTYAQSRISPSLAAILLSLESLAGVLFSLTAGKVGWSLSLALGCAIMVAASVSAAMGTRRSRAPLLRCAERAEPTTEPLAEKKKKRPARTRGAISGAFNAAYAPVRPKE